MRKWILAIVILMAASGAFAQSRLPAKQVSVDVSAVSNFVPTTNTLQALVAWFDANWPTNIVPTTRYSTYAEMTNADAVVQDWVTNLGYAVDATVTANAAAFSNYVVATYAPTSTVASSLTSLSNDLVTGYQSFTSNEVYDAGSWMWKTWTNSPLTLTATNASGQWITTRVYFVRGKLVGATTNNVDITSVTNDYM